MVHSWWERLCNGDDKALLSAGPEVFSVLVLCFLRSLHYVWLLWPQSVRFDSISLTFYLSSCLSVSSLRLVPLLCLSAHRAAWIFGSVWAAKQNSQPLRPLCCGSAKELLYMHSTEVQCKVSTGKQTPRTRSPITRLLWSVILSEVSVQQVIKLEIAPRLHIPHRW